MFKVFFASMQAMAQTAATDAAVTSAGAVAAGAETVAQQPPGWMQFVPFVIILGVMYLLVIRPQVKKQKEQQTFLQALKVGDLVIASSGILGRITSLTDSLATLEVANQVQIKMLRSQIMMLQSGLQPAKKEGN